MPSNGTRNNTKNGTLNGTGGGGGVGLRQTHPPATTSSTLDHQHRHNNNHRRHSSATQQTPATAPRTNQHGSSAIHLQICNALLALFGALALGVAVSQLIGPMSLPNHQHIDFRLALGFSAVLAGLLGCYCVGRQHGGIVVKCLYVLTLVLGAGTAAFYAFTTYRVITIQKELLRLEAQGNVNVPGGSMIHDIGGPTSSAQYVGKIILATITAVIGGVTALVAVLALILLEGIVIVEQPQQTPSEKEIKKRAKNRAVFVVVAIIKLILGLATLALAVWTETLRQSVGTRQHNFVHIGVDHFGALLVLASVVTDAYSALTEFHRNLNLKASIGLGVIAAVWTLKALDYGLYPFFRKDLAVYRNQLAWTQPSFAPSLRHPYAQILLIHGLLLGALALCSLISAIQVILAASCLPPFRDPPAVTHRYQNISVIQQQQHQLWERRRRRKGRRVCPLFVSGLHLLWALAFAVLGVVGLLGLPWTGDFPGADLFWLAVVAFGTAVLQSPSDFEKNALIKFVLNTVALGIAIEKLCVTVNLLYQSITYPVYRNPELVERSTYVGQIALNIGLLIVLSCWTLTSLIGASIFGRQLSTFDNNRKGGENFEDKIEENKKWRNPRGIHCCCAFGTLLYALVMITCYAAFEAGRWGLAEIPLDLNILFYRLGNGALGLVVFVVQISACFRGAPLLLASAFLQTVLTTIALFMLSPAVSNLYYLHAIYRNHASKGLLNERDDSIMTVGIVLTALGTLACVIQGVSGVLCILRTSYFLHHRWKCRGREYTPIGASYHYGTTIDGRRTQFLVPSSLSSTLPFDDFYGPQYYGRGGPLDFNPFGPSPGIHQLAIRPVELQTMYWSPDEDPYTFKSKRRVYGQQVFPLDGESGSTLDRRGGDYQQQQQHHRGRVRTPSPMTGRPKETITTRTTTRTEQSSYFYHHQSRDGTIPGTGTAPSNNFRRNSRDVRDKSPLEPVYLSAGDSPGGNVDGGGPRRRTTTSPGTGAEQRREQHPGLALSSPSSVKRPREYTLAVSGRNSVFEEDDFDFDDDFCSTTGTGEKKGTGTVGGAQSSSVSKRNPATATDTYRRTTVPF